MSPPSADVRIVGDGDGDGGDGDGDGDRPDAGEGSSVSGSLRVLTYNVAGLPQGVSGGNPIVNTPLISPLLNG